MDPHAAEDSATPADRPKSPNTPTPESSDTEWPHPSELDRQLASLVEDAAAEASGSNEDTTAEESDSDEDATAEASGSKEAATVHLGVVCDGEECKSRQAGDANLEWINGIRYKCAVCDDLDFCASCEPKHDPTHPRLVYREHAAVSEDLKLSVVMGEKQRSPSSSSSDSSARFSWSLGSRSSRTKKNAPETKSSDVSPGSETHEEMLDRLQSQCNEDEQRLLKSIADLTDIPDDYSHVHVDKAVTSALEKTTHLALTRQDQFNKGILKSHRITGAVLFGPPGTGKTLIAQAVAKKSKNRMLSISSGDVYQKLWGDDEKVIRAAFSLARKLHPCIMFVDEADGIFGARREDDKKHVRSMLSEFLREWDGATMERNKNPFVLLATNRPWDVDPAVLRRAPVRILMDVPTLEQRRGIFEVLLKEETLADDVTLDMLAGLTRQFSGSDIKSLCVSAAMSCVEQQEPDENGVYEDTRVIARKHFDFAFRYVKPTATNKLMARRLLDFQRRGD